MNYNPFQSYGIYKTLLVTDTLHPVPNQICVLYTTSELLLHALIILVQEFSFWKLQSWTTLNDTKYKLILRREL